MNEIEKLQKMMEEMAGAPKEEMGKRQPGEKGMYEIRRPLEATEKPAGAFSEGGS